MGYRALADRLIGWSFLDNVKVVCSARPYPVFLKAFGAGEVVKLHELTSSDISKFAEAQFRNWLSKPGMRDAQSNCLAMVEDITAKAEGIFLWATFVVKELVNQVLDDDSSKESLQGRLRECHECGSLDDLFQMLLQRVAKGRTAQLHSDMVLYLTANNPFKSPLNALIYSWLEELQWFQGPDQATSPPLERYSGGDILSRVEGVRSLLHQLTRGLLEVREQKYMGRAFYYKYYVDFCHRSVRDFLREHWKSKAGRNPFLTPTEEVQAYCRLRILEALRVSYPDPDRFFRFMHPSSGDVARTKSVWAEMFEQTFTWLRSNNGGAPPYQIMQDFERALTLSENVTVKMRPLPARFLYVADYFLNFIFDGNENADKTSFLHWAAYWSQGDFVRRRLTDPAFVVKDTPCPCEISLLLASSMASDDETTKYLLHQGYKTDDKIRAWHEIGPSTPTVWMVFLRCFAINVKAYFGGVEHWNSRFPHLDRNGLERMSRIVEAFLSARADPHVYFVLFTESPGKTYYHADLYQILDSFKPGNLALLDTLLKKSWWRSLSGGLGLLSSTRATHQRISRDVLLSGEWKVDGVCSESGEELMGGFYMRLF